MMLLHPAVLALVWCSAAVGGVAIVAAAAGVTVAVGWNPDDSSRQQLTRERRSLLVAAALTLVLGWQLVSLFLFVATAERLHTLFTGAMCAAGTLNASRFGYPALLVKVAVFVLCGVGLVVMRVSRGAWTTGLVRFKHLLSVAVAAALVAENVIQLRYFVDLDPEIITSCCATIFGDGAGGLAAGLAAVPAGTSRWAFFGTLALTAGAGSRFLRGGRSPAWFAALVPPLTALAVVAVISWIAPAFYQLPTHHCPFCLLSWQYGCVGHALYAALAVALVAGCASWLVFRLRSFDRFACIRPGAERRLCVASLVGFGVFSVIALWPSATSGLRLGGY